MAEKIAFERPQSLRQARFRFCPGCGHGILHRLLAECIDTLGLRERTIGIAPVGCAVFAYDYLKFDMMEAPHGRPPAVATALKRVMPDRFVFTYQGDGDLAAIGMAEIIHAAARGEDLTVIFVNNATYGMTGGQMAPTTLPGQKTTTTPAGRQSGHPIRMAEMMAGMDGVAYAERTSLESAKGVLATKRAMMKAFNVQLDRRGLGFLEVLSPCPTDWKKTPLDALRWMRDEMERAFPLGVFKDAKVSQA